MTLNHRGEPSGPPAVAQAEDPGRFRGGPESRGGKSSQDRAPERREPQSLQSTDQPVHVRKGGQERPTKKVKGSRVQSSHGL